MQIHCVILVIMATHDERKLVLLNELLRCLNDAEDVLDRIEELTAADGRQLDEQVGDISEHVANAYETTENHIRTIRIKTNNIPRARVQLVANYK